MSNGTIDVTTIARAMQEHGIETDIAKVSQEGWVDYRPEGDATDVVFTHQIPEIIKAYALRPELWHHTLLFLGPTAIGKTEAIRQGFQAAVQEMNRYRLDPRKLHLIELHVSQMGPVDALGVPRERDGRTYWALPEIWPVAEVLERQEGYQTKLNQFLDHYRQTGQTAWELAPDSWIVHFHDEVTNPSSPQVPHQLFPAWCGTAQGRMIGGHLLVGDFMTVLAGNRVEDGTNSINLAASAVSRMCVLEVVPHYAGWLQHYAFQQQLRGGRMTTRIHPLVIAFLNRFNDRFAPQDREERSPMDAFPTPRAWKFVSDLLYHQEESPLPDDLFRANVAGRIGNATGDQFFTFLRYFRDLPDIDRVLRGEPVDNWPNPAERPDLMYIIGTQMVTKLTQQNAKQFVKILSTPEMMPIEFAVMTVKQLRPAGKLHPLIHEWAVQEFNAWCTANRHYLF